MPNPLGKIGRLPFAVREQLNQRMLDHQPTDQILDWLNGLPEMIALRGEAGYEPVGAMNLSRWRNNGHVDWLRRREKAAQLHHLCEWSGTLTGPDDGHSHRRLAEGVSLVMTGQILEVMEGLARVQEEINELEDETERNTKWLEVSKTVAGVARALATVRGGDHECVKLAMSQRALAQRDESMSFNREKFQRLVCDKLLDAAQRTKIHEIAMSDAEYEQKLEAIRRVAFADVDEVERSGLLEKLTPP